MKRTMMLMAALLTLSFATQTFAQEENADPLEGFNRAMYGFNDGVDKVILKPLTKLYTFITPRFIEKGVSNFFNNLFYPKVIINQLLQGKPALALQDTTRFIVNSTIGIGGLFDVASDGGLMAHSEDFGQTLAVWGIKDSPYLVLPILGPSTVRDGIGKIPDFYMNPVFHIEDNETRYGLTALSTLDSRASLMKKEEIITGDKYLFIRDAYLQHRAFLINDKKAEETDPFLGGE